MFRSLFLFDMTFWLYLAALTLYVGYILAKRPGVQLAAAGHPASGLADGDGVWATQIGQVATIVTIFGWVVNTLALVTRAYERLELRGTFAPWSNQFEAMAYVSWAIILGYLVMELKYKIKSIGVFVVSIGFIAMGAASLLPYRYQTAEPLVPALNSYWIYIHVSVTLTSYAAFAMAGGLGVMYLLKERAERRGSRSSVFAAFPDLETIDELGYKAIMVGFPLLAFGVILGAMGQLRVGWILELGSEGDLVVDRLAHLRRVHPCAHDQGMGRAAGGHLFDFRVPDGGFLFLGCKLSPVRPARVCMTREG